eukprot:5459997-Amphidinium_carterae.1
MKDMHRKRNCAAPSNPDLLTCAVYRLPTGETFPAPVCKPRDALAHASSVVKTDVKPPFTDRTSLSIAVRSLEAWTAAAGVRQHLFAPLCKIYLLLQVG